MTNLYVAFLKCTIKPTLRSVLILESEIMHKKFIAATETYHPQPPPVYQEVFFSSDGTLNKAKKNKNEKMKKMKNQTNPLIMTEHIRVFNESHHANSFSHR